MQHLRMVQIVLPFAVQYFFCLSSHARLLSLFSPSEMNSIIPSPGESTNAEEFQKGPGIAGKDVSDKDDVEIVTVQDAASQQEHIYPRGLPLALTLTSSALAMFLISLVRSPVLYQCPFQFENFINLPTPQDRTIIATAIPTITNEFNSLNDIGYSSP